MEQSAGKALPVKQKLMGHPSCKETKAIGMQGKQERSELSATGLFKTWERQLEQKQKVNNCKQVHQEITVG